MTEVARPKTELHPSYTMDRLLDPARSTGLERELIAKLQADHAEPHRHHHTFDHPMQMVSFLDEHLPRSRKRRRALTWAALYHDSVYDPMANKGENEIASAAKYRRDLGIWMYDSEVDQGERFIIATADHIADPNDPDMQLFLDADLSILGSNPTEYRRFAENIRAEHALLSDREFSMRRTAEVLVPLLQRKRIFNTEAAHATLETQARRNILAEIDRLEIMC